MQDLCGIPCDRWKREFSESIVKSVSYKKGWSFAVDPGGRILIIAKFEDINKPGEVAMLTDTFDFSMDAFVFDGEAGRKHMLTMIYTKILGMEHHEASEWFKVDGEAIFNEHVLYPNRFGSA